jgi:hypothetical protein
MDAGDHLNTPLTKVEDLFPNTDPCENCSIPSQWISPLTCQWLEEFATIDAEIQMLLLAGLTHRWLATFFDKHGHGLMPTKQLLEERSSLRQTIERFLPMGKVSSMEAEAMYESCRWASLVLLNVEKLRIPIRVAAKHVRIQPRLIRCLRMTNLSNLWCNHKGLLFWVASICQFATAGQCFPLLCTTLYARFVQEIAMTDCCSEIAIKPLKRLKHFESLCCQPQPNS